MSNVKSTLTAERLREVLSYDPETGVFINRFYRGANAKAGEVAGQLDDGYVKIKIDGVMYRAHRLAWLHMTGEWPKHHIDHIDTQRGNNRWNNLRDATRNVNNQNHIKAHANSKTGVLGVSPNGIGFQAGLTWRGRTRYLGTFPTIESAHNAYLRAKRLVHEGNTL